MRRQEQKLEMREITSEKAEVPKLDAAAADDALLIPVDLNPPRLRLTPQKRNC
jgi:hypothetical protein